MLIKTDPPKTTVSDTELLSVKEEKHIQIQRYLQQRKIVAEKKSVRNCGHSCKETEKKREEEESIDWSTTTNEEKRAKLIRDLPKAPHDDGDDEKKFLLDPFARVSIVVILVFFPLFWCVRALAAIPLSVSGCAFPQR